MTSVRLTEIFYSIQGEGLAVGLPTVFVRLTGCSLRCSWCDTSYSFYGGEEWSLDEVVSHVSKFPAKRVCVTGGEPLDQREACLELMERLLADGYEVVLETSGGQPIAEAVKLGPRENLCVSLDVKCPSSGMQERNRWENLALLEKHDQLKFVVSDEADYEYAVKVLQDHPDLKCALLFHPAWGENMRWLAERILADGLPDVRLGTQLHKHVWGSEMGR